MCSRARQHKITTVVFSLTVPRFRFSRLGLGSDVSVSVVSIVDADDNGVGHALEFTASPDTPLPIVEGPANTPLPTGCNVSSLEFNTHSGWVTNDFNGFSIAERNSRVFLEVSHLANITLGIDS